MTDRVIETRQDCLNRPYAFKLFGTEFCEVRSVEITQQQVRSRRTARKGNVFCLAAT